LKRAILIFWALLLVEPFFAQEISDAERLGRLDYMKYASKINCDSTGGSNLEHRICLNLEFQKLDSVLHVRYAFLLESLENDSLKEERKEFQKLWIENRRTQSELLSNGWKGHVLGIYYLDAMIRITKGRIEEIEDLIEGK